MMNDYVVIRVVSYRHQAEYLKSMLESQGVISMVCADDAGGMRPELAFGMGGVRLLVQKKDQEKAEEIFKGFLVEEEGV